ncbi:MAG: transglycosylase domain-containing protein [Ignavibacteriales bacterium]|nr:transglycosylase domain-containing protein [Ignavibacteriales bacterium]
MSFVVDMRPRPPPSPILRARRERRLAKRRTSDSPPTERLPQRRDDPVPADRRAHHRQRLRIRRPDARPASVETLPTLLNPPSGLLLQPTRITDRTGENVIFTFAPDDSPRRYIALGDNNPQYLPKSLSDAVIATHRPEFWKHAGYSLAGLTDPELHPTLAQRLVFELLLFNDPPSLQRALRERILAAQVTAQFGRTQVLEWYLNSANFGRYAFGAESAAQLYFGKSATQLTTAESAILAAVSDSPSLNPYDAPRTALERGEETVRRMSALGLLSDQAVDNALGDLPASRLRLLLRPEPAPAFVNLLLAQLDTQFPACPHRTRRTDHPLHAGL